MRKSSIVVSGVLAAVASGVSSHAAGPAQLAGPEISVLRSAIDLGMKTTLPVAAVPQPAAGVHAKAAVTRSAGESATPAVIAIRKVVARARSAVGAGDAGNPPDRFEVVDASGNGSASNAAQSPAAVIPACR